jgi:hypothetical protein
MSETTAISPVSAIASDATSVVHHECPRPPVVVRDLAPYMASQLTHMARVCKRKLFRRRIDEAEAVLAPALARALRNSRFEANLRQHRRVQADEVLEQWIVANDYTTLHVVDQYTAPRNQGVLYGWQTTRFVSDPFSPIRHASYERWQCVEHETRHPFGPPVWVTVTTDTWGELLAWLRLVYHPKADVKTCLAWTPRHPEPKPLHLWTGAECQHVHGNAALLQLAKDAYYTAENAVVDEYTVDRRSLRQLLTDDAERADGFDLVVTENKSWTRTHGLNNGKAAVQQPRITTTTATSARSGHVRSHTIDVWDGAGTEARIELDGQGGARATVAVDDKAVELPDGAFYAYQHVRTPEGQPAILKALITPATCRVTSSESSNKLRGGAGVVGRVLQILAFERYVHDVDGEILNEGQAAGVRDRDVERRMPVVYYGVRYLRQVPEARSAVYGKRARTYRVGEEVVVDADDFDGQFDTTGSECGRGWSFHLTQLEALTWAGIPNITPALVQGYEWLRDVADTSDGLRDALDAAAIAEADAAAAVPIDDDDGSAESGVTDMDVADDAVVPVPEERVPLLRRLVGDLVAAWRG